MMYGVIDRIEGNLAVVEFDDDSIENIHIEDIKGEIKEGNVLIKREDFYEIDIKETQKRREEAQKLLDLWE